MVSNVSMAGTSLNLLFLPHGSRNSPGEMHESSRPPRAPLGWRAIHRVANLVLDLIDRTAAKVGAVAFRRGSRRFERAVRLRQAEEFPVKIDDVVAFESFPRKLRRSAGTINPPIETQAQRLSASTGPNSPLLRPQHEWLAECFGERQPEPVFARAHQRFERGPNGRYGKVRQQSRAHKALLPGPESARPRQVRIFALECRSDLTARHPQRMNLGVFTVRQDAAGRKMIDGRQGMQVDMGIRVFQQPPK